MRSWFLILCIACAMAAQAQELEVTAGGGTFTASGPTLAMVHVGVQGCLRCGGRLGLFLEYTHYFAGASSGAYNLSDQVRRADLAGGGLRIQGSDRTKLFFDVEFVGGTDEHRAGRGGAIGGAVVGGGVKIPVGKSWYVRPQARAYGLSPHTLEGAGPHWAIAGGVGFGYSWL